jgi:actin-related protein
LKKEIQDKFTDRINKNSANIKIRIVDSPTRKYSVFIGASFLAKVHEDFPETWKFRK